MRTRTVACLLALSLLARPALAAEDACPTSLTTPEPPTRVRAEVVERVMSARPDPSDRILLVGASGFARWPKHLRDEAFGVPSFRFALGADGVQQVLWRLDRADLSGGRFDRIVVWAGGNNLRARPCEVAVGVQAITTKLRGMFPSARIAVVSLLPRGRRLSQGRAEEKNRLIRERVEADGHRFVDAYPAFRARCGFDEFCSLYTDSVHLSDEGYRVLGDLLKN